MTSYFGWTCTINANGLCIGLILIYTERPIHGYDKHVSPWARGILVADF